MPPPPNLRAKLSRFQRVSVSMYVHSMAVGVQPPSIHLTVAWPRCREPGHNALKGLEARGFATPPTQRELREREVAVEEEGGRGG